MTDLNMALSKWLLRKSYEDAATQAREIKAATQAKKERNSGLFTAAQENLRRELGLGDRPRRTSPQADRCCDGHVSRHVLRPSRPRIRVRLRRK